MNFTSIVYRLQLLEVRERQEQRQRDIKAGLAGINPFAPLGMTVADAQSTLLGVLKLPGKLAGLAARWSKALDRLQPLLFKYQQLRHPPRSPIPGRPVDERLQCPVIDAIMSSVTPENDEERRQLAELGVLLRDGHDVVVAMLYGYLMRPALISLSHFNVQALGHWTDTAAHATNDDPNIVALANDLSKPSVQVKTGGPKNARPYWEHVLCMCANKLLMPPKVQAG